MDLQNKNVELLIQPSDDCPEEMLRVKGVLDFKTPGQRLRAVLYIEWKQREKDSDKTFQEYYDYRMNSIIERIKANLQHE